MIFSFLTVANPRNDRKCVFLSRSVYDEITGGSDYLELGSQEVNSRAYCSWFGFKVSKLRQSRTIYDTECDGLCPQGGDQQKKVATLSGGERNRCQLAKVVKSGANVLLLDEVKGLYTL